MHHLNVDLSIRPIRHKKRDHGKEQDKIIAAEVEQLLKAGHIREAQYSEWLCNVVLVQKSPEKWCMCNDFTTLNQYFPRDPYPLPRIDTLVDSTAGCALLSFMDAFQGFYQIKMAKEDIAKTAFVRAGGVYYYNVMPFGLRNAGAT